MATGTNIRTYYEGAWHNADLPIIAKGVDIGENVADPLRGEGARDHGAAVLRQRRVQFLESQRPVLLVPGAGLRSDGRGACFRIEIPTRDPVARNVEAVA